MFRCTTPRAGRTGRENLGNEPRRERAGFATSAEFRIRSDVSDESTTPIRRRSEATGRRDAAHSRGESARDVAAAHARARDTRTCLFASACKSQPVHLWSAVDGKVCGVDGAKNRPGRADGF